MRRATEAGLPVARLRLLIALVCASCLDPPRLESARWLEGEAPRLTDPEEAPPCVQEQCDLAWGGGGTCDECGECCASELCWADPDPEAYDDDEWQEHCSWAASEAECDLCGGGGCAELGASDDVDAGSEDDVEPAQEGEPWASDADCDEWYGGGGFCADCDDCCWSEACEGDDGDDGDESTWTDQDCDDWYGGGGFCADCAACCWSDSCAPADDESSWTDQDCDDWYGGGGFCVDCAACCWSEGCS